MLDLSVTMACLEKYNLPVSDDGRPQHTAEDAGQHVLWKHAWLLRLRVVYRNVPYCCSFVAVFHTTGAFPHQFFQPWYFAVTSLWCFCPLEHQHLSWRFSSYFWFSRESISASDDRKDQLRGHVYSTCTQSPTLFHCVQIKQLPMPDALIWESFPGLQ